MCPIGLTTAISSGVATGGVRGGYFLPIICLNPTNDFQ